MSSWALSESEELADRQFALWQVLIEDRTGIFLSADRRSLLKASLNSRMREVGSADYDEYYDRVTKGGFGHQEWLKLIERLTVRETRFFRDPAAFDLVREYSFSWFQECEKAQEPVGAWSVGCSTGEEVYGLAMVFDDARNECGLTTPFSVLGTDISHDALTFAATGRYSARRVDQVPEALSARYFSCSPEDDQYQVHSDIRPYTRFEKLNMLELARAPHKRLSLIYCQNVLIYFRQATRHFILNQLAERLRPTGMLVLGMGEAVGWQNALLQPLVGREVAAYVRRPT
jgi:type IV pilus assembly protein PilK